MDGPELSFLLCLLQTSSDLSLHALAQHYTERAIHTLDDLTIYTECVMNTVTVDDVHMFMMHNLSVNIIKLGTY